MEQVCILVLQGESTVASPAPKGLPQIEVSFTINQKSVLHVKAQDVDTGRHMQWHQSGGSVVAREATEQGSS